ncbi:hypothetical protein KIH86_03625 [Paenibacillus sp. HN-1]|uniref:hypothetical protein n=1 Tax=Paenibacillus TaxID=44249 RepID=UPI001CA7D43B|nr:MULTISPECIES: hypothetical protein [Paenibacillus]MBY9077272.1 hypothetical protein [Paenibacillus sp. CGMCC 1.18879]MBY9083319.1 hypothetical protein [Paenibacillus sinensis]
MAKKTYRVIADFVDAVTGEEIKTGSLFEADEKRLERLQAAEVIGDEVTKAEIDAAKKAGEANADQS